jgi:hypothetical protein
MPGRADWDMKLAVGVGRARTKMCGAQIVEQALVEAFMGHDRCPGRVGPTSHLAPAKQGYVSRDDRKQEVRSCVYIALPPSS